MVLLFLPFNIFWSLRCFTTCFTFMHLFLLLLFSHSDSNYDKFLHLEFNGNPFPLTGLLWYLVLSIPSSVFFFFGGGVQIMINSNPKLVIWCEHFFPRVKCFKNIQLLDYQIKVLKVLQAKQKHSVLTYKSLLNPRG